MLVHHRGQRGVVGRGDGTVHGRRGAVVGQLQVHAVRGALSGHHALQHVEGRLVCLVGETRGQRALQRCDAASVRHVFLGVGVTRIRNNGVLYFRSAPYLYAKCGTTQCPMASDTGHEARHLMN